MFLDSTLPVKAFILSREHKRESSYVGTAPYAFV